MNTKYLTQEEKEAIAHSYEIKQVTQTDLAIQYGLSRTTIRRVLHEFDLVTNNTYASTRERSMLDVLKAFKIENVERLRYVLQRGLK